MTANQISPGSKSSNTFLIIHHTVKHKFNINFKY